ncbi:esterase family protein [Arundinibacter roseus]|uniref:Esterase n=1 Tax=Arundinibacter roseus TaxID=2070510 RepID=A0A4R4KG57_9BACT|nr:alpha/beta hydrolase-fold protein [Arundinibacter roseus]TDB67020.1 esterase [Arundinibacter roseus]
MQENHISYYSHALGRSIDLLVYGHWGYPILLFPTTLGRHYQAKDMGLIDSVRGLVDAGKVKIYCVDSIDADSWYGRHLPSHIKVANHALYDSFLQHELVPFIQQQCSVDKIGVAGCSFGGYHAFNFAFRHPELVAYLISMSGAFDIRSFLHGHYDEQVYFNNPVDFVAQEQGWRYGHMKIILGTSEWDICLADNQRMSEILHQKGIGHWLDVRGWEKHDWPLWNAMFPQYLSSMF